MYPFSTQINHRFHQPVKLLLPILLFFTFFWFFSQPVSASHFQWSSYNAPETDPIEQAKLDWDDGDYIGALERVKKLLDGSDADRYLREIALLTGELYQVETVAADGRNPLFSPDGLHFSWEDPTAVRPQTRISRVTDNGVEHLLTVEGTDFHFSTTESAGIYHHVERTERMAELARELQQAASARDRQEVFRLRDLLAWEEQSNTSIYWIDLESGREQRLPFGDLLVRTPRFDAEGTLWFSALDPGQLDRSGIYRWEQGSDAPIRVTGEQHFFDRPIPLGESGRVVYTKMNSAPFPLPPGTDRLTHEIEQQVVLHDLDSGQTWSWEGTAPITSEDRSRIAFQSEVDGQNLILSLYANGDDPRVDTLATVTEDIQDPALSPDGSSLAYMIRDGISWNIRVVDTDGGEELFRTNDIQHELFPHFLDNGTLLAKMGEFRHRRAHIYDLNTGDFHRLFHNNLVRTVSLEYEWEANDAGSHVLVVAERDGDTISDEQGLYLVRLDRKVSQNQLKERVESALQDERELRAKAEEIYRPIRDMVRQATEEVNLSRVYQYQKALYDFGSKNVRQPGNRKAGEYIYNTLKSFGYEPELQWFEPFDGIESANVIARLEGTEHPEVVYILSSHYDSVTRSPGADDNSSGTAVLLETARVLAENPLPATIIFASLTAEEDGLLGAREFVRRADEEGLQAAGVVNNDMMGWTRHHRLDNTIRFSNHGIRDVQHSGAILFTDLITYDSRYYRFTDAHVFFDAYGDVIGGIGSYPILGNPNYHQTTDRLETMNHRLVREVAKSTTATLMNLASTPSVVPGVHAESRGGETHVSWERSPESDIVAYKVKYRSGDGSLRTAKTEDLQIRLGRVEPGSEISVAAVNRRGMISWSWSSVTASSD